MLAVINYLPVFRMFSDVFQEDLFHDLRRSRGCVHKYLAEETECFAS